MTCATGPHACGGGERELGDGEIRREARRGLCKAARSRETEGRPRPARRRTQPARPAPRARRRRSRPRAGTAASAATRRAGARSARLALLRWSALRRRRSASSASSHSSSGSDSDFNAIPRTTVDLLACQEPPDCRARYCRSPSAHSTRETTLAPDRKPARLRSTRTRPGSAASSFSARTGTKALRSPAAARRDAAERSKPSVSSTRRTLQGAGGRV